MKQKFISLLEILNSDSEHLLIECDISEYVTKLFEKATINKIIWNGKLIAFIAYYDNDKEKTNAFLSMIAVDPEYQNKGYGKILLNKAICQLKKKGFTNFNLQVLKGNIKAINFYNKFGFHKVKSMGSKFYLQKVI